MSVRKIVGLLAGFALAVGLIGAGVGAQFTSSVTAQENIKVGTFQCLIVDATPGATIYGGGTSVVFNAPDIKSSAAGSAPFSFTVKSMGSIPASVSVAVTTAPASPFTALAPTPAGPVTLTQTQTQAFTGGLSWPLLNNDQLGLTYSVVYTASCGEVHAPAFSVSYYTTTGSGVNTTSGIPTGFCRYATPQASVALGDGNGTASQVVNGDGSVTLSINGAGSYADTGFYVSLGTLGALQTAGGYSITATGGSVGTNLYFDTNNDGQFATWNGAGCWNGLGGDLYALGPSGTGTVAVNGSSTFFMNTPASGTIAFSALEGVTGGTTAISSTTQVAVWVGITLGSGGTASVTITVAP